MPSVRGEPMRDADVAEAAALDGTAALQEGELRAEPVHGAVDARLRGTLRDPQDRRDLVQGQVQRVEQHERGPVAGSQAAERLPEVEPSGHRARGFSVRPMKRSRRCWQRLLSRQVVMEAHGGEAAHHRAVLTASAAAPGILTTT